MIARAVIDDRVRAWGLREDVVEKDYVLGWVLWSIGVGPVLGGTWIFKGGTCLKKCYSVTSRFFEDLDLTVVEDGPIEPEAVLAALDRGRERAGHESGIDFAAQGPTCRMRPSGRSAEGRLYTAGGATRRIRRVSGSTWAATRPLSSQAVRRRQRGTRPVRARRRSRLSGRRTRRGHAGHRWRELRQRTAPRCPTQREAARAP